MNYIHALFDLPENGVIAIEVRGRAMNKKKLGTFGMIAGMGHSQQACFQIIIEVQFRSYGIIQTTVAIAPGATRLNHKVGNNPVKKLVEEKMKQVVEVEA